jgi:hypothetical protein
MHPSEANPCTQAFCSTPSNRPSVSSSAPWPLLSSLLASRGSSVTDSSSVPGPSPSSTSNRSDRETVSAETVSAVARAKPERPSGRHLSLTVPSGTVRSFRTWVTRTASTLPSNRLRLVLNLGAERGASCLRSGDAPAPIPQLAAPTAAPTTACGSTGSSLSQRLSGSPGNGRRCSLSASRPPSRGEGAAETASPTGRQA